MHYMLPRQHLKKELFLVGVLYDFWTLNTQISIRNAERNNGR